MRWQHSRVNPVSDGTFNPVGGNFLARGPLGIISSAFKQAVIQEVEDGAEFTPDLSQGTVFSLTLLGATATIANPVGTPVIAGFDNLIILQVTNASGDASDITFGDAYDTAFVAPADGETATVMLLNIAGVWYQLGS